MAAQGAGPGPGSAAPPGLEAARQKLALRRKKVLSAEEMELYELAQAAGSAIDPDVFKEKQRQHCPWGSAGPGRTQQPRRIQPEDAAPAQRYKAAQGGWAWQEPYTWQHLEWGRDLPHHCPQQRLCVNLLQSIINLPEIQRVRPALLFFDNIKAQT
ncbi:uncharacterized protein LOC120368087 isoform X3 [Saimiri boliviensis]|uniref:uncharacterized protein LOC120368087 isoform X3 n=1 Tax=Saimiri boliviensis TaxID=27679 RepID=UPI003D775B02